MMHDIQNQLGQAVTALAFVFNLIMGEDINNILAVIISVLSIVYLSLKVRREWKDRE